MQKSLATFALLGALTTSALFVHSADPVAKPDGISADGGRYYGPLVNGRFHGRGRMEWSSGDLYEGDFVDGLMSGQGRLKWSSGEVYEGELRNGRQNGKGRTTLADGSIYTGEYRDGYFSGKGKLERAGDFTYEGDFVFGAYDGQGRYLDRTYEYRGGFKQGHHSGHGEGTASDGGKYKGNHVRGRWDGKGRFENASKEIYEGDFRDGEFSGKGVYRAPNGVRYEGEFRKWRYNGAGKFFQPDGSYYEGRFFDGALQNQGRYFGKDGTTYTGHFRDWMYDGQGELKLPNGEAYKGKFRNGLYHGQGTLSLARPRDGKSQVSGVWNFGNLVDGNRAKATADVETALYTQRKLLDDAIAAIAPSDPDKANLYLLAVAGDGSQEVFRREIDFVRAQFAQRFGTGERSIALINSRNTMATAPMATVTSVGEAVKAMAAKMDKDRDILFVYLSSHGSPETGLYLGQNGIDLRSLTAKSLAGMLKESRIRWKVVVISACYAGGFLYPLRDDTTMVIAAARSDRKSFGCADENDFTYFGEAYFKDALPQSTSFSEAFEKARLIVEKREAGQQPKGQTLDEREFSRPQMHNPQKIETYLRKWWAQSAR